MRLVLTCLLVLSTGVVASAETCGELSQVMRLNNQRYVAAMGELKGLQAGLGVNPRTNAEAAMRAVRRYGLAIRDAREKRAGILASYRALVEGGCEPFDEKGLAQTRDEFRFYSEEEERIHATAQKLLANAAMARSTGLSTDP